MEIKIKKNEAVTDKIRLSEFCKISLSTDPSIEEVQEAVIRICKDLDDETIRKELLNKNHLRWLKHLKEYPSDLKVLSGYLVLISEIHADQKIKTEECLDCSLPDMSIDSSSIPLSLNADSIKEALKSMDRFNTYEKKIDPVVISIKQKGTVPLCPECKGMGKVKCKKCHGTGQIKCKACDGTGQSKNIQRRLTSTETYWEDGSLHERNSYKTIYSDCEICGGSGKVVCDSCGGDKEFPCMACSGTGRKDGASSAAIITKMHETYKGKKDSKVILSNGVHYDGGYPTAISEDDILNISLSKEDMLSRKSNIEKIEISDPHLSQYLNKKVENYMKSRTGVGLAIAVYRIPNNIYHLSAIYNEIDYDFYIFNNKLIIRGWNEMTWAEELFKLYKKKI